MADESTYGFSKPDAFELIQLIGNVDKEFPEFRPRGRGQSNATIEYKITSLRVASGSVTPEKPYTGLWIATVSIKGAQTASLIGTTVDVVDHSGCILEAGFENYTGWAHWAVYGSLGASVACDTMTPFHWAAINRCCDASTGTYAVPC